jgi:GMP synthase (glutamine-hydrolysing)
MSSGHRTAIAVRHVAFEDLGLLAPILADAGWASSYCNAPTDDLGDPSLAEADLLIVLGGPIGVYDGADYPFLGAEIALLERRLARGLPMLGICLGAQLMARALGARVFSGPVKEIGWWRISLTEAGLASCLAPLADAASAVLHWHGDTFDLPAGWPATRCTKTRLLPMVHMRWPCSSTWKSIRGGWRNGMSATPWNWLQPESRFPPCARQRPV